MENKTLYVCNGCCCGELSLVGFMILNSPDMKPGDKYLKHLLQESYSQESKHQICKLPCGHGSFELTEPRDVFVECNTCHKKYQLVWSMVNKKIRELA